MVRSFGKSRFKFGLEKRVLNFQSNLKIVFFLLVFTRQDVPFGKCGEAIESLQLILWPLADFGSVQEVRESMSSQSFPLVFGGIHWV